MYIVYYFLIRSLVNKILVSKEEQYGKYNSSKYSIGYNDNGLIRPLYLFLS